MSFILKYFWKRRKTPFYTGSTQGGKVKFKMPKTNELSNWNYWLSVSIIGGLALFSLYPVVVDPILHENEYKRRHQLVKTELYQSGYLPGQLRKWEDPWKRKRKNSDDE